MSQSVVIPNRASVAAPVSDTRLFAGIFVMSFSSLLLELSLTRVFSVTLFYHFAFLAISIALLGLGAGGVFAFLMRRWLERWSTHGLGAAASILNAVLIVGVLVVVLRYSVSLHLTWRNFWVLTAIYIVSAVPFFLTGLVFSVIFARETRRVGALYGADLVGGAAACLAVVPLLNTIGGPNAILTASLGMAIAASLWASARWFRRTALALALALAVLAAVNWRGGLLDVMSAKGIKRDASWILFHRWNALSRIEVDQWGSSKAITIDADAATSIMNVPPTSWVGTPLERQLMSAPSALVNILRRKGEYAIIGPGGGVDVLRAVGNGSPSVTGIEINPLIANTIMRGLYADYSYHLYQIPQVHIHVADGRSWVRNAPWQYDVVQMTLVDTWASTSAGAFALSENNLYTVQAMKEYFRHLKPDGMIDITRWEFAKPREALRVASVAMQALHELGAPNTQGHFLVVSDGKLNKDGVTVSVLAKKSPFTRDEIATAERHVAEYPNLNWLYKPGGEISNPFGELIAGNDPYGFARRYEFNVAPVTDNAPFFFFTLKLGQVLRHSVGEGMDWKVNLGVAVLLMLLLISIAAVAVFLMLPLWLRTRKREKGSVRPLRLMPIWYFIMIGLGYILVEIAFIQRFVLFLGHPTYALTVVVFLMLLASGVGSAVSRRWLVEPARVKVPLAVIVGALLVYLFVLPRVLSAAVGAPFAAKCVMSGLLLVPLGFLMGMPFPSGLRALHGAGDEIIEWAWAMNAASSVLGSVLAMVIAIQFGLNMVLICGATAYMGAAALTGTFGSQHDAGVAEAA